MTANREPGRLRPPTAIDLFAGCGGTTEGLKQAGFRVLGAVEIDPLAAETFMCNHPEIALFEDVRTISGPALLRALGLNRGELDLLAGCPPCQGFSAVRRLNGGRRIRDPNNALLREFLRLVRSIRPRAVILENVPWLLRTVHFAAFRAGLRRMGYDTVSGTADAQHYNVPQRRRRAILIGVRTGKATLPPPAERTRTVRDTIGRLPPPSRTRDELHRMSERRSAEVLNRIKRTPKDGGSRTDLPAADQLPCHRNFSGFNDIYGRMAWDEVAPTITGGCFNPSKGRFLHPSQNRNISMREAALLQSFPARYYFPVEAGKQAIARMIGNALPPEFVRRHALAIRRELLTLPRGHGNGSR